MFKKLALLLLASLAFRCFAIDLQEPLQRGTKLIESIPVIAPGFSKTIYFESIYPMTRGCGSVSLSAAIIDGEACLKYETRGWVSFNRKVMTTKTYAILDTTFHLKEWTSESALSNAPANATKSSVRVADGKLMTLEVKNGEKVEHEFPLQSTDFIWPAAEVLQWIKPNDQNRFALREMDPRGKLSLPKFNQETNKFEKSQGKSYPIETRLYTVVKRDDGSYRITADELEKGSRSEFEFDTKGLLLEYSTILSFEGLQENRFVTKVISKERMEELKASMEE